MTTDPKGAMAEALRAELARQWGAGFDNYVQDIDWTLMAQAALNAHRARYRAAIGDHGPVSQARIQLAGIIASPLKSDDADMEALGFLLHLLDSGWHPHGFTLMAERNTLFNALGDALQCMHDAGGEIDEAAVQRVTAVIEEMGVQP